jgi:hypothetical protein
MKKIEKFTTLNPRMAFKSLIYSLAGIFFFSLSSCEPDTIFITVVDEPLQAYFDRFIDEAAIRGLDVSYATSQVDAHIGEITEPNVIGQCAWSQNHQHSITLDRQYWSSANDMQREFVVFHELGHCVLGLQHIDDSDANGNCLSIMTSGTGTCRVVYNHNNRTRMLDELFSD